tara:strand:+ start:475 stop:699 length:225 start_codon:yes stop_codon:yes gene_type:complete
MKNRKIPFNVPILDTKPVEVTNQYTGEKVTLKPDALAVYDVIKGSEMLSQYEDVRKGCAWFMKHEPKAYMVLLD